MCCHLPGYGLPGRYEVVAIPQLGDNFGVLLQRRDSCKQPVTGSQTVSKPRPLFSPATAGRVALSDSRAHTTGEWLMLSEFV